MIISLRQHFLCLKNQKQHNISLNAYLALIKEILEEIKMSDFGSDFVVLTDEEGVEQEFEHLDTLENNGTTYMAFIPADCEEDEAELVILKLLNEGTDDEVLATIDDETELEEIFGLFMERLEEDEFYEGEEEDEE